MSLLEAELPRRRQCCNFGTTTDLHGPPDIPYVYRMPQNRRDLLYKVKYN